MADVCLCVHIYSYSCMMTSDITHRPVTSQFHNVLNVCVFVCLCLVGRHYSLESYGHGSEAQHHV